MYLFSDQDVLIYETNAFTQVDKWELSRPIEEGFGRLEFGSRDILNDEPGTTPRSSTCPIRSSIAG